MIKLKKVCDMCGCISDIDSIETEIDIISAEYIEGDVHYNLDICKRCFFSIFKVYARPTYSALAPSLENTFSNIKFRRKR